METCQVCGNTVEDFDICTHEETSTGIGSRLVAPFINSKDSVDFENADSNRKSVTPFILGPFAALILDIILPTWSTLFSALLLVFVATIMVNVIWNQLGAGVPTSFTGFLRALPHHLATPKLIRLHSTEGKFKKQILAWIASLIVATFAVLWVGTPGNSKSLEQSLQNGIKEKTGQTLGVVCPAAFLTIPGSATTCHVKLILGLKVPVRVTINDVLGHISWNASLN